MANAIITFEVMPKSPESDFEAIKEQALVIAKKHGAKGDMQSSIEPIAFGLKKVVILGMYEISDDKDFDQIADEMAEIADVGSSKVAKMDLAMG